MTDPQLGEGSQNPDVQQDQQDSRLLPAEAEPNVGLESRRKISSAPLHVVLYQPQIPQNTGNIARSCVALGAKLWIVRPTTFRLDSSQLKRAGLDYWKYLEWETVDSWGELLSRFDNPRLWLVSKFGKVPYYETPFAPGDVLVLGRETNGLPDSLREEFADRLINIPMPGQVRSLNQSNAAAIVMFEAARQIGLLNNVPPLNATT